MAGDGLQSGARTMRQCVRDWQASERNVSRSEVVFHRREAGAWHGNGGGVVEDSMAAPMLFPIGKRQEFLSRGSTVLAFLMSGAERSAVLVESL